MKIKRLFIALLFLFPPSTFSQSTVGGTAHVGGTVQVGGTFSSCAGPNCWANRSIGINVPGGSGSIVGTNTFDSAFTLPSIPGCGSAPCVYPTGSGNQAYYTYYDNQPNSLGTDCTIALDGCSLKITILNGYFQGEPGEYDWNFCAPVNTPTCQFGAGSEFYIQWATRLDPGMIGSNPLGAEGFKHGIITAGDTASTIAPDCNNNPAEIVPIQDLNSFYSFYPWMYVNCGYSAGGDAFTSEGYYPLQTALSGTGNFLDQNASGCPHYSGQGAATTFPTCVGYTSNTWLCFQVHVKIGTFNAANSTIEMWFGPCGSPLTLISQAADADIVANGTDAGSGSYGKIQWSAYNTSANWNVNTAVWIDDGLVSKRRIPDPNTATPNAPDSLSLTNISGTSITVDWRVNSHNSTGQDDTGFYVQRCTNSSTVCLANPQSGFSTIATTAAGVSSYTDTSVSSSSTYTYRVAAKNSSGTSARSIAQCFNSGPTCGGTAVATGSSSALATLAAATTSGTFAAFTQDATTFNQCSGNCTAGTGAGRILVTATSADYITQYANNAGWDPVHNKLDFYGAPHGGTQAQGRTVVWSDSTNTWAIGPNPTSLACFNTSPYCVQHSYEHNTVDPATGDLYYRMYGSTTVNKLTYTTQTWSTIAAIPWVDTNCCEAIFWTSQGLVAFDADWGIFLYNAGSNTWTQIANTNEITGSPSLPQVDGFSPDYEVIGLWNSTNNTAMLAAGTTVWEMSWSGSAWVFTEKGTAPVYQAINSSLTTYEPVHGNYLVMDGSNNLWTYNITSDTWTNTGKTSPFNAEDGAIAVPVPVYGVTLFVQYNGSTGAVYIYKP